MRRCSLLAAILLLLFATPAVLLHGQVPGASRTVLEDGTSLRLRFARTLSSADAKVGERVDFEVLEDVKVGDLIVIPKGGLAVGTVTEAEPKKRLGRSGKLNVSLDHVRLADGRKAALRAVKEVKGEGEMTAGIVPTSLFLFVYGKDITIPKGTEITAYVNGSMELAPGKSQPAGGEMMPAEAGTGKPAENDSLGSSVLVSSIPPGADIELDRSFVGSTPSIIRMPEGEHQITIKKKGFKPWERKIKATLGSIKVEAELEPD